MTADPGLSPFKVEKEIQQSCAGLHANKVMKPGREGKGNPEEVPRKQEVTPAAATSPGEEEKVVGGQGQSPPPAGPANRMTQSRPSLW
jgi:hypothetical protein